MGQPQFPSEKDLRSMLLEAAERFHELTGLPMSEIGRQALNDTAFISSLDDGRNISLRTFEYFMCWLRDHWPTSDRGAPSSNVTVSYRAKRAKNGRRKRRSSKRRTSNHVPTTPRKQRRPGNVLTAD